MPLRLCDLHSHPATWAGSDQARLDTSVISRPHWLGRPVHVDRCHLSSLDAINHHAARNHVRQADIAACVPGASKASVPSGAEAGAVPPVGLEPTTFGLKVRRPVVVWLEHTDVLIRNWLARCAAIASNSTIAGNASNASSKGLLR